MNATLSLPRVQDQILPSSLYKLNPAVIEDLVRLGNKFDGGYLVSASALSGADALVSFGLGGDWSFEEDAVRANPDLTIHVYDHTWGERKLLDHLVLLWHGVIHEQGSLSNIRSLVETYEAYRNFFRGNIVHFQERVFDRVQNPNDVTVERILARLEHKTGLIVKMDIEGGEYRVVDALLDYHDRIRLIVGEFHATELNRKLFLEKIERICQFYEVIHLHGTNLVGTAIDGLPDALEITFLQKGLCKFSKRRNCLPVAGLDFPNNPRKSDHHLVFAEE